MTCLLAGVQEHPRLRQASEGRGGGGGGGGTHAKQETVRDERELLVFHDQPAGTPSLKAKTSGKTGQRVFVGTCVWHIRIK